MPIVPIQWVNCVEGVNFVEWIECFKPAFDNPEVELINPFLSDFFEILAKIECSTCGTVGKNGLSTQFNLDTFFI